MGELKGAKENVCDLVGGVGSGGDPLRCLIGFFGQLSVVGVGRIWNYIFFGCSRLLRDLQKRTAESAPCVCFTIAYMFSFSPCKICARIL